MQTDSDIMRLFVTDPLGHTDQDIDAIIKKLRDQRHAFNAPKTAAAKTPAKAKPGAIDLGSIDLDL